MWHLYIALLWIFTHLFISSIGVLHRPWEYFSRTMVASIIGSARGHPRPLIAGSIWWQPFIMFIIIILCLFADSIKPGCPYSNVQHNKSHASLFWLSAKLKHHVFTFFFHRNGSCVPCQSFQDNGKRFPYLSPPAKWKPAVFTFFFPHNGSSGQWQPLSLTLTPRKKWKQRVFTFAFSTVEVLYLTKAFSKMVAVKAASFYFRFHHK